jgi:hypothetical protein
MRATKTSMPYLLDSSPRRQNNIIVRRTIPPPLFSCSWMTLNRSSPGNHQAWAPVEGGHREFASRLKKGSGADLTASGSVRVAGTFNYKRKYAPNFPV